MTRKRTELSEEAKSVLRSRPLHWRVDEASGNVQINFAGTDLINILRKDFGFSCVHIWPGEHDRMARIRQRRTDDILTYVEIDEGGRRKEEVSFIEILHPKLNAFIKEELLGLPAQKAATR